MTRKEYDKYWLSTATQKEKIEHYEGKLFIQCLNLSLKLYTNNISKEVKLVHSSVFNLYYNSYYYIKLKNNKNNKRKVFNNMIKFWKKNFQKSYNIPNLIILK